MSDKYLQRGVSSDKKEVHDAIQDIDKGLYPNAFCKILPDFFTKDEAYCSIMHSDTAGTKTILAYLYWKETGDISVWDGIVQDAIVMNTDDIACSGLYQDFVLSSTILRNKNHITGEVIKQLITAQERYATKMQEHGIHLHFAGGETADVGDVCRTADVGFTVMARGRRQDILDIQIQDGDVVVGIASYGQAVYESSYNSGIGCNGLTSARHDILVKRYATLYPETFDPILASDLTYIGSKSMTDLHPELQIPIGKLLLSPTRTYLPFFKLLLEQHKNDLHGIIHCTGGGMTKVLHFVDNLHIIKNNLLPIAPIFDLIQAESHSTLQEMFKVYNMGCRLEIYCKKEVAAPIIALSQSLHLDAQIIGYCTAHSGKKVSIQHDSQTYTYN